eukprot:TRINITY_DN970_c0_g1_i6.p4 TRINITY_DN970_c0_g1~~TRINITY_DN970_c0_g1_i6.p4  ORF type:complete len:129 (+),score=5.79 TRINITY_DN970_c0_g1_i6:639-1025(+)
MFFAMELYRTTELCLMNACLTNACLTKLWCHFVLVVLVVLIVPVVVPIVPVVPMFSVPGAKSLVMTRPDFLLLIQLSTPDSVNPRVLPLIQSPPVVTRASGRLRDCQDVKRTALVAAATPPPLRLALL